MMRDTWLAKYDQQTCYWLLDHGTCEKAKDYFLEQAVQGFMTSAEPLFIDPPFDTLKAQTPWLIPVSDTVLSLPESILSQGILLHSHAEKALVARHLRSLLNAELAEEQVLFRFYDTKVLTQMLPMMSLAEQSEFMGNIDAILIQPDFEESLEGNAEKSSEERLADNEVAIGKSAEKKAADEESAETGFIELENDKAAQYQVRTEPWWIIAPEHLAGLYNIKHHAYAVSRRLWEMLPSLMSKLKEPLTKLETGFEKAKEQKLSKDDAELWVLAHIANATQTELDELVSSLKLDTKQQEYVQEWMENSAWQL